MRFSRRGEDRIGRTRAWEIGFVEESRPTIVRTSDLRDQPIEGRAWIDPEKGTLLRAVLRVDVYQRPRVPARSARPPTTMDIDHSPAPVAQDRRERLMLDVEFGFDPTIELFVPADDARLMAAAVSLTASGIEIGSERPLFQLRPGGQRSFYDVAPDGRFLVVSSTDKPENSPITLVVNWAARMSR